jgi:segregation and condensation protein B
MIDSESKDPLDAKPEPAEQETDAAELSRSYESLLGQQEWQTDVPSDAVGEGAEASERTEIVSPPALKRIVEALLFVGGAPLTAAGATEAIRGLTAEQFTEAIADLNQDYRRQGRPYFIHLRDQGYALELRPNFKPVWDKLYGTMREARLSTAAIDVLALVAYRQPATKQEIEAIRGAESGHLLRQLVRRRLITVVQRGDSNQREVTYGTTERFLELFGLKSLDDLPQTQDLQKL